jgi:hypothetical protein
MAARQGRRSILTGPGAVSSHAAKASRRPRLATLRRACPGGVTACRSCPSRWVSWSRAAWSTVAALASATALAAAAYTGTLPAPAQQFAHSVIGAPSPQPGHRPGTPQPGHRPGTPQAAPARTGAAGPDAAGPAASGLCTAYAHAKAHGTASQKAMAFRNLAAAAGGAAKIAAYCAAVPHPGRSQSSQPAAAPTHPAGRPASHPTGKPSSHPTPHPAGRPSSVPTAH